MISFTKNHGRVTLILLAIILVVDFVYLGAKYQARMQPTFPDKVLDENQLYRAHVDKVVELIQQESTRLIPEGSFDQGVNDNSSKTFDEFFQTIRTPEIFRMKVWDKDFMVIWANAAELIGKSYPDDHAVTEALEGKVEAEVEQGKAEQFTENSYSNFVEVYVPVKDTSGQVVGVIEVYSAIEDVISQLRQEFWYAVLFTVIASVGVFALGYLVIKRFIR